MWEPDVQPGGLNITLTSGGERLFVLSQRTASRKKAHDAIRAARSQGQINARERRRLHDGVNAFFDARPVRVSRQSTEDASFDNMLVGDFEQVANGVRRDKKEKIRRFFAGVQAARASMGLPERTLPGERLVMGG